MENNFKFYNTLTRQIDTVVPRVDGKIGMYTCGPTVYHFAHIGNIRSYIMEDVADRHAPFHDGKSLDTLITYYNTRKALFHYIVSRESIIFSNCFRLIWMRLPFRITQPAVGFSSASRRSLFSPIRKYLDASSMVSVYFSQIGTSLLLITWPPFFSKQRLFFAKVGRK